MSNDRPFTTTGDAVEAEPVIQPVENPPAPAKEKEEKKEESNG